MSGLYDLETSRKRVALAEQAFEAQKLYVASMTASHWKVLAEKNLVTLSEMQDIARRTHILIVDTHHSLSQDQQNLLQDPRDVCPNGASAGELARVP